MLLALVAAAALPVSGFLADPALAAALGRADLRPGAWAEYLVRSKIEDEARVRITALAGESEGRCWVEIAAASASGVAGAVRLLLRGGDVSGIERMQVLLAGQQALEVPLERLARSRSHPPSPEVRRLGNARVKVAAGVFETEVQQVQGTRVWRAASVPLWGLVKARSGQRTVELLASGVSGGRSVFPAGWDHGKGSESAK